MYLLTITFMGFAVGMVGTGMGGLFAFIMDKPSNRIMSVIMGFAAGLMLAVVTFDLLPHSFEIAGLQEGIIGIILGVIVIFLIDNFLPDLNTQASFQDGYVKAGILLGIAIALHNLPEGLAIGSGFLASPTLGLSLALVILLHDLPEGIAMAMPMRIGGESKLKTFLYTVLAGIPTGIGSFIGFILGEISPIFISICLGFAGGAMLYIICGELIPKSRDLHRGRITVFGMIFGILAGIIISKYIEG